MLICEKSKLILGIENVSKSFSRSGDRVEALINVSIQLDRGDFMGILGPGSAGKTTLLKLAAGLESPDVGTVTYRGKSLSDMKSSEIRLYRRREVGCVWGSRYLNPGLNVLDNVALPLLLDGCDHRSAESRAREQLAAVGVEHCTRAKSDELSDGELQRVAIAQALVTNPRLLLADEPAANLDLYEQDSLLALFQSLARDAKMAVLITDTDATALMRARPILYLRDGELLNEGPAKDTEQDMGQVVEMPSERLRERKPFDA